MYRKTVPFAIKMMELSALKVTDEDTLPDNFPFVLTGS